MREKGRNRKEKKILIRVSKEEKDLAEMLSKKEGKNTSEFFRSLIKDHSDMKALDKHLQLIKAYEETLLKYKQLLEEHVKKAQE
jgi:uncharacterized protein (DUF1778 family)